MSDTQFPQLVEPAVAAKMAHLEPQTLANHRSQGRGLPYVKLGGKILYDVADIRAAIEKSRVVPATQPD